MGAFVGACLLAMASAAIMRVGTPGAIAGGALGFGLGLWLVLHNGGLWAGKAIAALTGAAIMMVVCLAFVAFS
jgi:hypothetical protein